MQEENLIPINQVNFNIDAIAEKLFIGPQGRLVEKIQTFNNKYGNFSDGEIVKITKKFAFKPGTYDRIKEAHGKNILKYHMKPSSMWSLKDRITKFSYLDRHFWQEAIDIHNTMLNFRHDDILWQENTHYVEVFLEHLIERLNKEQVCINETFPNNKILITIDQNILDNEDRWHELRIIIDIKTKDINLNIIYQNRNVCEYNWGDIETRWTMPIWSFLNNWCEGGPQSEHGHRTQSNPWAKIIPKYKGLQHPYISRHHTWRTVTSDEWNTSTCTGDHQSNLIQAVWKLDLTALIILTRTWLSKYHIPNTNPLNRYWECIYGLPEGTDATFWTSRDNVTPTRLMLDCKFPSNYISNYNVVNSNEDNNPCDICQLRDGYSVSINKEKSLNYDPCLQAIHDYNGPLTESEAIKEACILHIMVCDHMRADQERFNAHGFNDILKTTDNLFPKDAELSNIYQIDNSFNLESEVLKINARYLAQDHESLLDNVFETNIFDSLIVKLSDLLGYDLGEVEDEWRDSSLEAIRAEITRVMLQEPLNNESNPGNTIIEESLTPEERSIRWAASRGSAINI